jgi:hypothetical protein
LDNVIVLLDGHEVLQTILCLLRKDLGKNKCLMPFAIRDQLDISEEVSVKHSASIRCLKIMRSWWKT